MLAIITSDSHGHIDLFRKLIKAYPDADLYLDAGDSEKHDFELVPFISVKGNCDAYIRERYRIIGFGSDNIYLFHGAYTNLCDKALYLRARRYKCNIIIHGHTHVPKYHIYQGIHIICPGSVVYPRFASDATYVLLRREPEIKVEFIKVKYEKSG
ncbi:MAG: YfcE family phosphodiesterase [Bacilli bacterium]|nr:YfcE family phosphodiesterase [Bacilli bacterium]MDD4077290.1 YfcE family phosphodiesterase [Bacilli bacterium]MDD4388223.1 YfcE family phosphodiesterase [Bacilli bacterium]